MPRISVIIPAFNEGVVIGNVIKQIRAVMNKVDKGHEIIVCGDINTAHEEIDLARPKENEKNTGFLPEERVWIDELINHGYIDTFRHLHPNTRDAYTYWDIKTGARNRNVGWRLDYFFTSSKLLKKISHSTMLSDFLGSDHCPIEISLLD